MLVVVFSKPEEKVQDRNDERVTSHHNHRVTDDGKRPAAVTQHDVKDSDDAQGAGDSGGNTLFPHGDADSGGSQPNEREFSTGLVALSVCAGSVLFVLGILCFCCGICRRSNRNTGYGRCDSKF